MKRSHAFVSKVGTVKLKIPGGQELDIPLFPGILKHLSVAQLRETLTTTSSIRKYTCEALRTAPWPALKEFPRPWLRACLDQVEIREGRKRALEFLLSP